MTMYTTPVEQILDGNGDPISGAKKFLFNVGTTTKKTVFSDSALTTARANPVLSDADGRFPQFFLNGLYDEEQQDNSGTATGYDGAKLWGPLPVGEVAEGALTLWATDNTYDIPEIVLGSDNNYYRSLTDSNTGNDPISAAGSWEQLQWGRVWNTNITYAKNDSAYGDDGFLYVSTQAANTAKAPPLNSAWWKPATNQNQSCVGAGTVDAITATLPIPLQSLNDETMVTVRASGANTITNPTFAPDGLAAKTITKNGNQALAANDISGPDHELQFKYNSGNNSWELLNPASPFVTDTLLSGNVLQVVETSSYANLTTTASIPFDDTIPQISEGSQYLTVSITPKYDDSNLFITFSGTFSISTSAVAVIALFKDAVTDAIEASPETIGTTGSANIQLLHKVVSGATSSITFRIRAGTTAGTLESNGVSSARKLGGVSGIHLSVTEVKA